MDTYAYKGISDGKYVEGDIEALNQDEASHKLKEQKIIITNMNKNMILKIIFMLPTAILGMHRLILT